METQMTNNNKDASPLRHYTNVGCLKSILEQDALCLSDGRNKGRGSGTEHPWDDQNDVEVIKLYYQKTGKTPYIGCFTHSISLHHWEYYGKHNSIFCKAPEDDIKCCIVLDYPQFQNYIMGLKNNYEWDIQMKSVTYMSATRLRKESIKDENLLFTKKYGFGVDKEERVVLYSSKDLNTNDFHRSLRGITKFIKKIVIYKNGSTDTKAFENAQMFFRNKYPKLIMDTSALTKSETWLANLKKANK